MRQVGYLQGLHENVLIYITIFYVTKQCSYYQRVRVGGGKR
jgi:hypothetical protein